MPGSAVQDASVNCNQLIDTKGTTMTKNKKSASGLSAPFMAAASGLINGVLSISLLLLFIVFPLICHNSYLDILETKFNFYQKCIVSMLSVMFLLAVILAVIDLMEFKGSHTRHLFSKIVRADKKTPFFAADAAVFIFWVSSALSTLLSPYTKAAFYGNKGRFSGLFLLSLYVISYYLISHFWKPKRWCAELFLASGAIVCIIGITDYFQLDILGFHKLIDVSQIAIFTSTIGNINTYTAYVGLVMGFSAAMFALEDSPLKTIWYYLCLCVSFAAIIMGCSDNAYLSMAALFGGLPFLLFKTRKGIFRYLTITATLFTIIQVIDVANHLFPERVLGLESLFLVIVNFRDLPFVVLFFWIIAAGYGLMSKYFEAAAPVLSGGTKTVRVWAVLMAAGIGVLCFMFFDANVANHADRYGPLQSYLVFSNEWGTNRGYIWRRSLQLYREFPLLQKLFGYGPDTFGLLARGTILEEMVAATGQIFDSAHNAFIQYLLTIGFAGSAGYLAFLIAAMYCMGKNQSGESFIFGALFASACYALQSTVNIDLPIVTPVLWLMLSIGMAGCRFSAPKLICIT